jgi:hypothetical protein
MKPALALHNGLWHCSLVGTWFGCGDTPASAYADWLSINAEAA